MDESLTTKPMPTRDEFELLVKQANDGEPLAAERLRKCLDDHPEIYKNVGDLSRLAIEGLISAAAGENQMLAESIRREVEAMRCEFLGPTPSLIERIAVGRILVAFVEVNFLSIEYPRQVGASPGQKRAVESQKAGAERRLQNALKSLPTLRTLVATANEVGQQKVRVAKPG